MLRIRLDDILTSSVAWKKNRPPEHRFEQIAGWLAQAQDKILHVPTIIVKDVQKFPRTVEFLKKETGKSLFPELHGWEHIDYAKLTDDEIREHLDKSIQWFADELDWCPKIWATPWGAESHKLTRIAKEFSMEVEGVRNQLTPGTIIENARVGRLIGDGSVMEHWWVRGNKLYKIAQIYKYGSYEEAKAKAKSTLDIKIFKKIWE